MKITKSLIEKYINQYVYVNTGFNANWIVFITKIDSEFVYSTDSVCLDSKKMYNNFGIFTTIQSIKFIRSAILSEIRHVKECTASGYYVEPLLIKNFIEIY